MQRYKSIYEDELFEYVSRAGDKYDRRGSTVGIYKGGKGHPEAKHFRSEEAAKAFIDNIKKKDAAIRSKEVATSTTKKKKPRNPLLP